MATTSGLTRPSAVKPKELKGLRARFSVTEPTVKIPFASAGTVIFPHAELPSLPALEMTNRPLSDAQEATREMKAVRSSSWSVV